MTQDTTAAMYANGRYIENNPTWHQQDSAWKAQQIIDLLRRISMTPKSICDVGCGAGAILSRLSEEFRPAGCEGYELSPDAFSLTSQYAAPGVRFHNADLLQTDSHFDLVMAIDVFEHVEDYMGWLRKLRRHGAVFLFNIPLELSVQTILRRDYFVAMRRKVGHIHHFSHQTAIATLQDCGYEIIASELITMAIQKPGGWKARAARLPRKILQWFNKDFATRTLGGYSLLVLAR